jgi:hypothetical protein
MNLAEDEWKKIIQGNTGVRHHLKINKTLFSQDVTQNKKTNKYRS